MQDRSVGAHGPGHLFVVQGICYTISSKWVHPVGSIHLRKKSATSFWKFNLDPLVRGRESGLLQGLPEPRQEPLYLRPPQDGVCRASGIFPAKLYEVKGNIYGLASAPRTWGLHVIRTLLQSGWKQSSLDKMLFFRFAKFSNEKQPTLAAVLLVYVDDFLLAHDKRFNRDELTKHFTWGSEAELSLDTPLEFKGKQLVLERRDDKYVLSLNQTKFINAMVGGKVAKKQFADTVKAEDMPEFRSVAGSLQWVAGQTRPDVAATVSLSCKGTKSTYQNLNDM